MTNLPRFATEEFIRRRANARKAIANCRMTVPQAERRLLYWAAITLYAGGELPEDIARHYGCPARGELPAWWELTPEDLDPATFLKKAMLELQASLWAVRARAEQSGHDLDRARALAALYNRHAAPLIGPMPLHALPSADTPMKEAA